MRYIASTMLVSTACLMAVLTIPYYGWVLFAAFLFHALEDRDA